MALLERIERSGARMLDVGAPPGYGKTTLLAQWAAGSPDPSRTAWVAVDADDRGARLWSAVLAALHPILGERLGPALEAAGAADAHLRDDVLVALLDALAASPEPIALVLDDVHLVLDDRRTADGLDWVLDRWPAPHAVALGARRPSELAGLGRRRIRGELFDVRTDGLRFDREETARLLRAGRGLPLDEATITTVQRRAEGWPAALQLVGLRLRLGDPPERVLARLTARDEGLFGGLVDEALASGPAHHRRFLRETSLLGRITADLGVRTLGGDEDETRTAFRELTRSSLLLVPLDRTQTWFRCHPLLRDVLRGRLEDEDPARARELHLRAARWLESEGGEHELDEAVEHYLAAHEWDPAAELLARHSLRLVGFGTLGDRAREWLGRFPAAVVREDARLAYVSALVAAVDGDRSGCELWLAAGAAAGWSGPMPDGTGSFALAAETLGAMVCFDDVGAAVAAAERVLDELPRAAPARTAVEALAAWHELLRGHHDAATVLAERAIAGQELLPSVGIPLVGSLARAVLALVALERGAVDVAEPLVDGAEIALREGPPGTAPHGLPVVCARARLLVAQGRAAEASERCRIALDRAGDWRDSSLMVPAVLLELARARAADGDRDGARDAAGAARARLDGARDPGKLRATLAAVGGGRPPRTPTAGARETLSDREHDVLRALAGSGSLRDIADGLRLSRNTVKTHVRTLYAKLAVGTRRDAVARGRELGYLGGRLRRDPKDRPCP